jgi:hypothetical protein
LLGRDLSDRNESSVKYKQLGIPRKLKKLKSRLGSLPSDIEENILSINAARNILVHHDGVVPETYVNDDGLFRVSWHRLILSTVGEKGQELRIGDRVEGGEGVYLRVISEHRDYRKSESVQVEAVELAGICWTVFTNGDKIREIVEEQWIKQTASTQRAAPAIVPDCQRTAVPKGAP